MFKKLLFVLFFVSYLSACMTLPAPKKFKKSFTLSNGKKIHLVVGDVDARFLSVHPNELFSVLMKVAALLETVTCGIKFNMVDFNASHQPYAQTAASVVDFLTHETTSVREVTLVVDSWRVFYFDFWLLFQTNGGSYLGANTSVLKDVDAVMGKSDRCRRIVAIAGVVVGVFVCFLWRYCSAYLRVQVAD